MRFARIMCLLAIISLFFANQSMAADNTLKLISDLNVSVEKNKQARSALIKRGEDSMPALRQEISGYRYLARENCLHAARALRVVREIGSGGAVQECVDILSFVPGQDENQILLLNEALDYLFAHFRDIRSRDAYYDLLKNRESKWLTGERDFVRLFVFSGIAPMAENNDSRVDDILALLLKKLPYEPTKGPGDVGGHWTVTAWLGTDGFTRQGCKTIPHTYNSRTERGPSCFFDPYYRERMLDSGCRYRVACLQLAKEYGSKRLITSLEPLLRSSHRDERDLALVAIETLNKKIDVAKEKIDQITLVNGDQLTGTVAATVFTIVTPYARLTLNSKDIKSIHSDVARKRAVVELLTGDRFSGTLLDDEITVTMNAGGETKLKLGEVESISFGH